MPANNFNDQLCTEDLLSSQKFLSSNYNNAVHESANAELRRDLTDIQRQEQEAANRVFQVMNQRGWYQVAPADSQMLNKARTQARQSFGSTGATQGAVGTGPLGSQFGGGMGSTMGGTGGGMGSTVGGSGGMGGIGRGTPSGTAGSTFQAPSSGGSSGIGYQERGGRQAESEKGNF